MENYYTLDEVLRCENLLRVNEWEYNEDSGAYVKDFMFDIEFFMNGIRLFDDTGIILHLPINYYALVGALIEYKQIPFGYNCV